MMKFRDTQPALQAGAKILPKVNAVFDLTAQTATCDVIMSGSNLAVGFDDWEATASNSIWFVPATATTTAIGLAINNA